MHTHKPLQTLTHAHSYTRGVQTLLVACVAGGHLHLDQVRNFSDPRPHLGATTLLAPKGEHGGLRQTVARLHCWLKCYSRGVFSSSLPSQFYHWISKDHEWTWFTHSLNQVLSKHGSDHAIMPTLMLGHTQSIVSRFTHYYH